MSQFTEKSGISTKVILGLIVIIGIISAILAGGCFYLMDIAGLVAYSGFLLFGAVVVGCVGAVLIYLREGQCLL